MDSFFVWENSSKLPPGTINSWTVYSAIIRLRLCKTNQPKISNLKKNIWTKCELLKAFTETCGMLKSEYIYDTKPIIKLFVLKFLCCPLVRKQAAESFFSKFTCKILPKGKPSSSKSHLLIRDYWVPNAVNKNVKKKEYPLLAPFIHRLEWRGSWRSSPIIIYRAYTQHFPCSHCQLLTSSQAGLLWVVPEHAQLSKWITVKATLPLLHLGMSGSDMATSPNITPVFC